MKRELIATATFGLEAVVKRELEALGFKILKVEDARITYLADERGIVRSNLWLRSADRVMIKVAEFTALEFEELFQNVKGIPWEEYLSIDANFIVNGGSVKSKLHSVPSVQSVSEKAIVSRLEEFYGVSEFAKSGSKYSIKVAILKDRVTILLDTSGSGLHRRGYRVRDVKAPIKETLAAALVQLSFWNKDRLLCDPMCGSGTIPIEAAMIGKNIAPGLGRSFISESWDMIDSSIWKDERRKAFESIQENTLQIYAGDIDEKAIEAARENAIEAGVDDVISFEVDNIEHMEAADEYGIIVTNPPYGERVGNDEEVKKIYSAINKFWSCNPTWSLFIITTDRSIEEYVRKADKRRKLYNGRLEACYYQFHGTEMSSKTL